MKKTVKHSPNTIEKAISDKYGDTGLQVYTLIDGHKTSEQILHKTHLHARKLVEIIDFMNKNKFILLKQSKHPIPA